MVRRIGILNDLCVDRIPLKNGSNEMVQNRFRFTLDIIQEMQTKPARSYYPLAEFPGAERKHSRQAA
jgi:hypothetical protein